MHVFDDGLEIRRGLKVSFTFMIRRHRLSMAIRRTWALTPRKKSIDGDERAANAIVFSVRRDVIQWPTEWFFWANRGHQIHRRCSWLRHAELCKSTFLTMDGRTRQERSRALWMHKIAVWSMTSKYGPALLLWRAFECLNTRIEGWTAAFGEHKFLL